MAKLKNPLLSFKATGGLGKLFSLAKRQGRHIIERKPIPTDAKSPAQLFYRNMFSMCKDLWHLLSEAEKAEWERSATPRHMTGYAWYLSQCLRPNPGIYLPLIGGTMTGEIKMGTNPITGLPHPTGTGHAARKSYVDARVTADILTHKGIPAAHHARYTDAEVAFILAIHAALVTGVHGAGDSVLATILNIATHTGITDAHHARYTNGEADARIAIHALLAAAHHIRYTDGEAKAIKLDDFATPDDNTDLNFTTARHGLVPKGTNIGDFLKDDGGWAPAAAGLAFYSEADDLSDLTLVRINEQNIPASFEYTILNITSGGCRFLGGSAIGELESLRVRITVDGGAEQTLSGGVRASSGDFEIIVPPILAHDSLLIKLYNTQGDARDCAAYLWYRAL